MGKSQQIEETKENDFLDMVVATALSTVGLMGIFVVLTVIQLLIG